VTEFRDYLACPFRYYLRHRLKLESFDDAAVELDGGLFGSLAHQVLREFGRSAAAAVTDAEVIYRELGALLDEATVEMFGKEPLPAVAVQIEQLRLRLEPLAQWQAGWAAAGWKIHAVEASPPPGTACLQVDGQPMELRGRIDRIDINETTGQAAVFDYKTSDATHRPEQTHRRGGEWVDLQLPLYRHLAQAMGIAGSLQLGYILLPKDTTETGDKLAQWSEADLAAADAAAANVVRMVRAGRFWPPESPPPMFFDELAAICQEGQFGGRAAAELGEGENGQ
jgi:ATP-dependent helicase/nuclease subunit B